MIRVISHLAEAKEVFSATVDREAVAFRQAAD